MSAPVFITATGTDTGKTHILAALLKAARLRGQRPDAIKPVHSGFNSADPASTDSARLLEAMGRAPTAEAIASITPFRFLDAVAPDKAAARAGVALMHADIVDFCTKAAASARCALFIEGAGGVMSPIAGDALNLDLIRTLQARPVLVCGAYLGAISHTLTAVAAMRATGVPPVCVLVNPHPPGPASAEEMAESLARFACPATIWRDGAADGVLDELGL